MQSLFMWALVNLVHLLHFPSHCDLFVALLFAFLYRYSTYAGKVCLAAVTAAFVWEWCMSKAFSVHCYGNFRAQASHLPLGRILHSNFSCTWKSGVIFATETSMGWIFMIVHLVGILCKQKGFFIPNTQNFPDTLSSNFGVLKLMLPLKSLFFLILCPEMDQIRSLNHLRNFPVCSSLLFRQAGSSVWFCRDEMKNRWLEKLRSCFCNSFVGMWSFQLAHDR